ncbi:MAG: hypothetical protein Q8912_12125, partial [Bacillota bacterium]|nr:hypothetical protein [Bacillota bacterium]
MRRVEVCGVEISVMSGSVFSGLMKDFLSGRDRYGVSKTNTEFLNRSIGNKNFQSTLNESGLNIPDGRGVLWAARYLTLPITRSRVMRPLQATWQMIYSGAAIVLNPKFITYPIPENIPGVDALKLMLGAAETTKSGVFFFGAT